MRLKAFMSEKLLFLLNKYRIVVWYDATGDFKDFIKEFNAPNCTVLTTVESTLNSRREADILYGLMHESENHDEANRNLLIYNPVKRGAGDDAKRLDPFEVYALIGAAFGDTEDQTLGSLARQAMPDMVAEINRLFEQGKPDLNLLNGLEEGNKNPLLKDLLGTETPADIIALALACEDKAKAVAERAGCAGELLRLLDFSIGFKHVEGKKRWMENRQAAAAYLLISEFILSTASDLSEDLVNLAHAGPEATDIIFAACDRMRSDLTMESGYTELAKRVEEDHYLADLVGKDFVPGNRHTFAFEERLVLLKTVKSILDGDFQSADEEIKERQNNIWRRDPQKEADWIVLERSLNLLKAAQSVAQDLPNSAKLGVLVKRYAEKWSSLDRTQRLFENAFTASFETGYLTEIVKLCRSTYRDVVIKIQELLMKAIGAENWPPEGILKQTHIFKQFIAPSLDNREKTAYFLVDGLRYEMGLALGESLEILGEVNTVYAAGVVPSVTDLGMAALMPGAEGSLQMVKAGENFVPALGEKPVSGSAERMNLLKEKYGDRFMEARFDDLMSSFKSYQSNLDKVDLLVVRTQDPDQIAETFGTWRANKYLTGIVGEISAFIKTLSKEGFKYIVVTADHGHIFLPEIPPGDIVPKPPGDWLIGKRRYLLGHKLADAPGTVTFKADQLGLIGDVAEICIPSGLKVFSDGSGYFHGGLSLQETIIPVVVLRANGISEVKTGKPDIEIRYRDERFKSRVISLGIYMAGGLFIEPKEVIIEVYDGKGSNALLVGEAVDCEARDANTGLVTLLGDHVTQVPILMEPDFKGEKIEIRVIDPQTRTVWAQKELINEILD